MAICLQNMQTYKCLQNGYMSTKYADIYICLQQWCLQCLKIGGR